MAEERRERWMLRLDTYRKALERLAEVVELSRRQPLTEIERDALIQRYEFTYEMAWKLMMSYEKENGLENIRGSKDIIREAFRFGLIDNADVWIDMVDTRNRTVHNYDEEMAEDEADKIINTYYPMMEELCRQAALAEKKALNNYVRTE